MRPLRQDEVFGLIHPAVDAHTLGIGHVAKLLSSAGYRAVIGRRGVCEALNRLDDPASSETIAAWVRQCAITRLGVSARLDEAQAAEMFAHLRFVLRRSGLYATEGAPIRGLAFAGLPGACRRVQAMFGPEVPVFDGQGSAFTTLLSLGVPYQRIPNDLVNVSVYDDGRLEFGRRLVEQERASQVKPPDRRRHRVAGSDADRLVDRLDAAQRSGQIPLVRSHFGPYGADRERSVAEFVQQVRGLAEAGHLDVLSIGTSQLTQERFGMPWGDRPNGGGVPINSAEEYARVREAARPMLVRTYAGTDHLGYLARVHEQALGIAWHALSFWWFSRLDGRGPHRVLANLKQHLATIDYIASTGTPFEANVPHHFAFRGGDDVTFVLSGVLAARAAKAHGIRHFVLQVMLNTPRHTAGVADLAKARALLSLVREVSGPSFKVTLQPRAGLDFFANDETHARAQLAAVTALMWDIEPHDPGSPEIIHVVGFSEANRLATPEVINESVQITRAALLDYAMLRRRGLAFDVDRESDVGQRTDHLIGEVRVLLRAIESCVPDPASAEGLYRILRAGFLAVPYLWEEREEFVHATIWNTAPVDGGVSVVDAHGRPVPACERAAVACHNAVEGRAWA